MPGPTEITRSILMRSREVADYLGVSRKRVDQMEALGRLPEPGHVEDHRMWDRAEIEAWADHMVGHEAGLGVTLRSVRDRRPADTHAAVGRVGSLPPAQNAATARQVLDEDGEHCSDASRRVRPRSH